MNTKRDFGPVAIFENRAEERNQQQGYNEVGTNPEGRLVEDGMVTVGLATKE